MITIGSFGESGFIEDELLFVDERKAKSMIEYEVHPGDRRCLAPNPTVANVPEADMMTGPSAAMRCPLPVSEIWPLSGEEGSFSSSDQGIGRIAGEFGYHQDV
ncbi:hypothetical protein M527_22540 [Sphingobium indicum IP26]|uniref:Uncharacterized protein n=1 Tax=Sphingobium indicum F2 TaxID=1450518 RepID=A0A8E0WUH1_9SPHN|nr:hypothetical protein M527_22540 [Sphingobium indicum IP26]EQB06488.1 hypothetical protein L286_06625 [Sphingobium sp. HDIP04]KER37697.1 hypothetical protein AL00_04085 [Sphingobium indicum F2]